MKKILIVDDDPVSVQIARRALEKAGYTVFYAVNGEEGLEVAAEKEPDVIITDIVMPGMDGVDFYKELRKVVQTAHTPVIVITENNIIEDSFRCLGVNEFLAKPLDSEKVVEKVNRLHAFEMKQVDKGSVLILGNKKLVLKEMETLLKKSGYTVFWVDDGAKVVSRALSLVPDIVLVDVLQKDLSAKEVIKALRCFLKLTRTKIFTYNMLSSQEIGNPLMVEWLNAEKDSCASAGADHYLGMYNHSDFADVLSQAVEDQS